LRILSGLELGEPHRHPEQVAAVLRAGRFDRVLGSVHTLPDRGGYAEPPGLFTHRDPGEVVRSYLAEVAALVTSSEVFAVLAHVDYAVRSWPAAADAFAPEDFEEEFRHTLRLTAESGRVLEVNTVVPFHATMLRWWRAEGGDAVTFGSDAHDPAHSGARLPRRRAPGRVSRLPPRRAPVRGVGTRMTDQDGYGTSALVLRATSGVILGDADGRILLMRRAKEDTWAIPGGGVKPGESWTEAALRECREETGWEARIDELLGIYSDPATQAHRYPSGTLRQFVGVVFMATALRRVGRAGNEEAELRWVTADDLPDRLFVPDRPVLRDAFEPRRHRPVIG
jgi:ADP-ribose pyrophosphatase YjhB (NUDIX family)